MFFKRKQRKPGPSGTGEFIDNIHWWFWDDAVTPGLLSRDAFSEVRSAALPTEDAARLSTALVCGSIESDGKRDAQAINTAKILLTKVNDYLARQRETDPDIFSRWVKEEWTRADTREAMLDVFKAYINVLEFWGYPYSWQKIRDARDLEAGIVLQAEETPRYFISENDIKEIRGRPFTFTVWMDGIGTGEKRIGGGNWRFNYEDGGFDMIFFRQSEI